MQMRLGEAGMKGIYFRNAVVWHYVPECRCSRQWALTRSVENGRKDHMLFAKNSVRHRRKCLFRYLKVALLVRFLDLLRLDMKRGFMWRVKKVRYAYAAGVEK